MDPIDTNPCSYKSIGTVLKSIYNDGESEWIIIGCDGLPYILGPRLIENTFTCPECKVECTSQNEFDKHIASSHGHINVPLNECKTYGHILLIPGLGHNEINYINAIFKLMWTVIFIDLVKLLGYRSIKALASCESASNHHNSWQIFQTFLQGTSREIITYYVRNCINTNTNPTVDGLYKWVQNSKSPNLKHLFKVVFTYCLALHFHSKGVRRNNKDVILSAMNKLTALFYGLNMAQYMEIDLRHKINLPVPI